MVRTFLITVFLTQALATLGQENSSSARFKNLPLVVTVNFNAIATPFHKIRNNFKNVGLRVGTEVSWNRKQNLLQSFNVGYFRNRLNGDGFYLNSEFIYRPAMYNGLRVAFKAGPGLVDFFLPSQGYKPDGNGSWTTASNPGKISLLVNTGIGISYEDFSIRNIAMSSFLEYEIAAVTNYNRSVPLLPMSFINAGSRLKF